MSMPDITGRELKLFQFSLLALAVQGYTTLAFWHAFDNDERRVVDVQKQMRDELARLVKELWGT